ncbi:MAG TPA: sulfotransferase [Steroidobacteraceae bacterium]|jgi:hypothetical protein|nr:sulfotransferase [Steroidobacteraceae bacterium]
MRLAKPFYRLPVRFDVARLQQEVSALPAQAWVDHPNDIAGNSALALISVGGSQNDEVDGIMQPTASLQRSPYLRQVLSSFAVAWSRSRLMRLAPYSEVPEHADINYHWYYRVRIHIPVFTHAAVEFRCGKELVHMAAGEAWLFDNWRRHSVVNPSGQQRIHLVADTTGSAAFWRFVARGDDGAPLEHRYDPQLDQATPMTERMRLAPVMPPAEVDLLLLDLCTELSGDEGSGQAQRRSDYQGLLDAFRRDWRQHYTLFGDSAEGWPQYAGLREQLRGNSKALAADLVMRTNGIGAHKVLEGRLLRALLPAVPAMMPAAVRAAGPAAAAAPVARLQRPIFIVAAPRSGSTLLFETLASSQNLVSLGGEAHWLVEDIEALRPGAPGVDSNRLSAAQATDQHAEIIMATLAGRLLDADNAPVAYRPGLRALEKTPKNALRIPFFNRIFPDALFVFLWRDPRENLSSIIEAWRSGRWRTYNGLPGFERPWSMLLPPGWPAMDGRPLEQIAAFQWTTTNRIALDDLARLPSRRWLALSYAELIADPAAQIRRICSFADIELDARLTTRIEHPLPLARFTQTPPDSNKWRRNAELIERVMPAVEPVWRRLQALNSDLPLSPRTGSRDAQ